MNSVRQLASLFICSLLISACGSHPQLAGDSVQDGSGIPADVTIETAMPVSPYYRDRRPVSADAQRRFDQALDALAHQSRALALGELQALAQDYPQLSGPALNIALIYQQAGDIEQAEQWFERSIASNPANLAAYNQYGIFLREQGRFPEAEQAYLEALAVWEPQANTHRNIGVLYDLYMGEREQALQHYYRYQELSASEDRAVAGWIADLEHQPTMLVQGTEQ